MKNDIRFRSATIEATRSEEGKPPTIRMSVSSEAPVLTMAWVNDEYQRVYEILDHSETSVDMTRCKDGLVILDGHGGDQIGLMAVEIKDRKIGGLVQFCSGERARNIAEDAAKGLRRNASVGYRVDPAQYKLESMQDGVPVVRAMSWMPYEASFVPVPADVSVGVGRSENIETQSKPRKQTMSEKTEVKLDAEQVVEIYRLARAFNVEPGQADEHIKSGKSLEEFRALALKKAEADRIEAEKTRKPDRPPVETSKRNVFDQSEQKQIAKRYNVMNVLRYQDEIRANGSSSIDIGFELEVSKTVAKRTGKGAQGIIIPHSANLSVRADPFLKVSNGSNMVATTLMLPLIEALRTKMVLASAGVEVLSGLTGDVAVPKGGTITGGWVDGENGTGTEGKPTIGQVTGTPKTASGWTQISRRLLIQSSVDVERFVENELMNTVARLIEVAAFAGTNAHGQPKGLTLTPSVNKPSVSAPSAITRAEVLAFIEGIASDNAEFANMAWMMPPAVWANLANIPRGVVTIKNVAGTENVGGGAYAGFLLDTDRKSMEGFNYGVSMNVPAKALFFGAWSQLVIGLWSGIDIVSDPYTNGSSGAVNVYALQDCDIMVRHPQAFAFNSAVLS